LHVTPHNVRENPVASWKNVAGGILGEQMMEIEE
jgi:hypothetical protein